MSVKSNIKTLKSRINDNHEKIKDVLYSVSEIMLSNEKLVKTWISDLL